MIQLPLSGAQKCAVLLLLLDERAAAALLRGLDPHEVRAVGDAMLTVAEIEPRAVDAVIDDFLREHDGVAALGDEGRQVRAVLTEAFGARAQPMLGRLGPPVSAPPFASLAWAEPAGIAAVIAAEHPQVGAVILAHLPHETAAAVLAACPEALQPELLVRLARLGPVAPAAIASLEADVETQLRALAAAAPGEVRGGAAFAAKLLGGLSGGTSVIEAVRTRDPELAGSLSELLFVFADLIRIDRRTLQTVVQAVEPELLVVALKGADATLRAHILGGMSQRAAAQIEDDIAGQGRLKRTEVDAAQAAVAAVVRRLADAGEIVLPGGAGYV